MYSSCEIKIHEINFWADVQKILGHKNILYATFCICCPLVVSL